MSTPSRLTASLCRTLMRRVSDTNPQSSAFSPSNVHHPLPRYLSYRGSLRLVDQIGAGWHGGGPVRWVHVCSHNAHFTCALHTLHLAVNAVLFRFCTATFTSLRPYFYPRPRSGCSYYLRTSRELLLLADVNLYSKVIYDSKCVQAFDPTDLMK